MLSDNKRATNAAYDKKQEHFHLRIVQSHELTLERIRAAAEAAGESLNAYITRAIAERIKREEEN